MYRELLRPVGCMPDCNSFLTASAVWDCIFFCECFLRQLLGSWISYFFLFLSLFFLTCGNKDRANSRSRATSLSLTRRAEAPEKGSCESKRMTRKGTEKGKVCVREKGGTGVTLCVCVEYIPPWIVQAKMSVGKVVPTTADCSTTTLFTHCCCARR